MAEAKILIIEDENIVALDIRKRVEQLGYDVCGVVATGEEAIARSAELRPDLVFMDIKLKGDMDGIEAAEKIRKQFYIPVVYLTAYADERTLERAKVTQPFGYIMKPVEDRELRSAIEIALHKHEMETKIRESEKQYKDLFDNANDLIQSLSPDACFLTVNKKWQETLGYREEDLAHLTLWDIVHPDSVAHCKEFFQKVISGEEIDNIQAVFVSKGGRAIEVEGNANCRFKNGKPVSTRSIFRDITERRRAEKLYKALAAESLQGLVIIQDFRIVFANQAFEEIAGYTTDEIPSLTEEEITNLVHPEDQAFVWGRFRDRLAGKPAPQHYEFRGIRKDRSERWLEMFASRIDYRGKPAIRLAIVDITDRKQVERALKDSEEKYRQLFEMESDAIFLIDRDTGRILEVNARGPILYGYSREELLQMKNTDVSAEPEQTRKATLATPPTIPIRYHRKKDGTVFPVEITARHFTWRGSAVHIAAIRDITLRLEAEAEREKLQAQLQRAQKMEAIGTLAGGIAHDFNNLLMGIEGNAALMLLDTDFSHSHYEKLKNIEQYVRNGADLTKQLLGFARGGKYEVHPTDVNDFLKKSSDMFGRTKKEISIHPKYHEGVWTVEVDQGQIEQMLLNLYVNAWQAMPGGGELYLQTENVILDENDVKFYDVEVGKYVKISITDTGVGMDEATQQRIFDPFFTTKEMGRGTGLGLASVYGIIKNHGGIINVYSEKGKGTTFNIYLPASEKEVIEDKILSEEVLKGTETVLLVDDEEMITGAGGELLEEIGYRVLIAGSGKEAIDVYEKNRDEIDLVILDMTMPVMGGGETYDRLKETNPDIKVLLSSGYSIDGEASEILDRGCNGFIQKPFNVKELSRRIREILDKK